MANITEENIILRFSAETDQALQNVVGLNKNIGTLNQTAQATSKALTAGLNSVDTKSLVTKILQAEGATSKLQAAFKKLQNNDVDGFSKAFEDVIADVRLTSDEMEFLENNIEDVSKAFALISNVEVFEEIAKDAEKVTTQFKNAKQELRFLTNAINSGELEGDELITARNRAAQLTDEIGDVREQIKNLSSDTRGLDTLIEGTRAVAAGFSIAEGAAVLFGEENEDVQKALLKLNGIMAISNGLQEAHALLLQNSNLRMRAAAISQSIYTTVVGTSTGALKLFRIALAATGVGLLVIGLGALIANFDKVKKSVNDNAQAMFDFAKKVTTFIPPLNALVKAGEYVYKNFDQIKVSIFALDDAISGFFGSVGDVLGNLLSGDFDAAYESFNQIGANTVKAFQKGQQDELIKQRESNLANILIERNKTLERSIRIQESLGKDAFESQKQILINELNTLRLQNADKEAILDKETEYQSFINERKLQLSEKAKENAKKASDDAKKAREKAIKDELDDIEKSFVQREIDAKREIKDAEELSLVLQRIELEKQEALLQAKLKNKDISSLDAKKLENELLDVAKKIQDLTPFRKPVEIALLGNVKLQPLKQSDIDTYTARIKELKQLLLENPNDSEIQQSIDFYIDAIEAALDGKEIDADLKIKAGATKLFKEGKIDLAEELLEKGETDKIQNRIKDIQDLLSKGNFSSAEAERNLIVEKADLELSLSEKVAKAKKEASDKEKQAIKDIASSTVELTNTILNEAIRRKEGEISIQEQRVQDLLGIIDQGNAEQVQLEEERLRKLNAEKERYLTVQKRLAAIEIAINNAIAISAGIKAIASEFGKGLLNGIAASIALAAQIASTIIALRNAFGSTPAFEKGIEDTSQRHRGNVDGRGGFNAILHPKERVVPKEENLKLLKLGVSNKDLPKYVGLGMKYEKMRVGTPTKDVSIYQNDNRALVNELKRNNKQLEDLKTIMLNNGIDISLSNEGLRMATSKAKAKLKREMDIRC